MTTRDIKTTVKDQYEIIAQSFAKITRDIHLLEGGMYAVEDEIKALKKNLASLIGSDILEVKPEELG